MSGWQQQVELELGSVEYVAPTGVIGIVVAQKFPDPKVIRTVIEDGLARVSPETVWVMREAERKGHAVGYAWQTFRAHGVTPFIAPLVPFWDTRRKNRRVDVMYDVYDDTCEQEHLVFTEFVAGGGRDMRAEWRDIEMRGTCSRIVVFHDKSSNVTAEWLDYRDRGASKIHVVERGVVREKKRKSGRAPVGMYDHRSVAARQRDEGIARVAAATPEAWKEAFEAKAREIASRRIEFTYEDVIRECPPPSGAKAQGCSYVMTRLRKEGVIEWTGRVAPATRLTRNVGYMKVWRGV